MYQVISMFNQMPNIDKVMFIVWSIALIGMVVSLVRLIIHAIVSNLFKAKTI